MDEGQNAAGDALDVVQTALSGSDLVTDLRATGAASGALAALGITLGIFACVLGWFCFKLLLGSCWACINDVVRTICCCCAPNRKSNAALNNDLWGKIAELEAAREEYDRLPSLIALEMSEREEAQQRNFDDLVRIVETEAGALESLEQLVKQAEKDREMADKLGDAQYQAQERTLERLRDQLAVLRNQRAGSSTRSPAGGE
jgi:hypothetical protein